ncbi:MAG: hypothetical protein R3C43_19005 [Chloroflexota bacterium]
MRNTGGAALDSAVFVPVPTLFAFSNRPTTLRPPHCNPIPPQPTNRQAVPAGKTSRII